MGNLLKANSLEEMKALLGEAITDEQAAQTWRELKEKEIRALRQAAGMGDA